MANVPDALARVEQLLADFLLDTEQEPDFDESFVLTFGAQPQTVQYIVLPRSLKHVELSLTALLTTAATIDISVFDGEYGQADVALSHPVVTGGNTASNAICAAGGSIGSNKVVVREVLSQGGVLTVYVAQLAVPHRVCDAIVRVRQLDKTQARGQRT